MADPPASQEVAPGVHRCGSTLVNWYLVVEDDAVTVVDAGLPGYWPQLDRALESLGRSRGDIAALVLTHGDGDHIGFAERLRSETGAPVLVHSDDERLARESARKDTEAGMSSYLWRAAAMRLTVHFARNGAARIPGVAELSSFEDGATLDVPDRPRALHTPGHTEGHCLIHIPQRGVVFAGDALCTLNPLTGARGPQLMPRALNVSSARALASLERLADSDADVILPGHGEPWRDGAAAAVERARAIGPT